MGIHPSVMYGWQLVPWYPCYFGCPSNSTHFRVNEFITVSMCEPQYLERMVGALVFTLCGLPLCGLYGFNVVLGHFIRASWWASSMVCVRCGMLALCRLVFLWFPGSFILIPS
jgi:hypothetical protein